MAAAPQEKPWKPRPWKADPQERRRYERGDAVADDNIVDLTALAGTWTIGGNSTPETKVFTTYELLEQILFSILVSPSVSAMKTVLLGQRVNRNFKHVIGRSEQVQQKLFFKPICPVLPMPTRREHAEQDLQSIEWNPLLSFWKFESRRDTALKTRCRRYKADPSGIKDFVQLNGMYSTFPRDKLGRDTTIGHAPTEVGDACYCAKDIGSESY